MKFLGPSSSGSQGGSTWSRNRFGQYVRRRAIPVNPASGFQGVARANMSASAAAWRGLSDAQRAGWESLGGQIQRTDALGQSYTFNGFMAFCLVNNNRRAVGDAPVTAAPTYDVPTALATVTPTLTAAAFSLAYTPTPMPASTRLLVYVSPQRSAGRNFEADRRLLAFTAAAAASPFDIFALYSARFGTPVVGNKVFITLEAYRNGFRSGPLYGSAIVA